MVDLVSLQWPALLGNGVVATASTVTLTKYAQQGATFIGQYLVSVITPERLLNAAKEYSTAAAGVGIYGAIGFTFVTILCQHVALELFHDKIVSFLNADYNALTNRNVLKHMCSYLACSGGAGIVVSAILVGAKIYSIQTAAAVVGTALSIHFLILAGFVFTLKTVEVAGFEMIIKSFVGAVIGTALVVGRSLLGRVEVFLGLTPGAAGLTYSAGAGVAALTLGIKHMAVKFFDTIFVRPTEKYIPTTQHWVNKEDKDDHTNTVYLKDDLNKGLAYARDIAIDVAGSATAAIGTYGIVRALDWVAGPTAKIVIAATLISQMAVKGVLKMMNRETPLL